MPAVLVAVGRVHPGPDCPVCPNAWQVNENAKKDLKEGLLLYNTENNVGLKNAWNIIQAEVRGARAPVRSGL